MKPQLEHGFTRIANGIIEALSRVNLSAYETRVRLFIFRITYGFNRREADTSISQIARVLGLDRRHVQRAVKSLEGKNIITVKKVRRHCEVGKSLRVAFQKDPAL